MREIEFRLWDIEQKIMFYNIQDGMLCKNSDNKLVLGASFGTICRDANSVVMQYIGRKYANGQKMFEGDLVQDEFGCIGAIVYSTENEMACYVVHWADGDVCHFFDDAAHGGIKKIGTVYENPELAAQLDLKGLI